MHEDGEPGGSSFSPESPPPEDGGGANSSEGCGTTSKSMSPSKESRLEAGLHVCAAHHFRSRRHNYNCVSVACQTDATDEFPSRLSPNCAKTTSTDQSATSSSSTDGVLRLMIQNFPNMNDTVRGPVKRINGVHWRIMVMPRQHVVQKKGTQKCLGFFLQCCPDAYSDQWSCQASAELRLISQKAGVMHFTRKTNHVYTAKENDWGYSCFMTWADILDENQGYIKEDKVVLEVSVKADAPKNILTKEEFQKQIQSWYDLAELQYNRGYIDLAIEANQQAIKFCKDKDDNSKDRLEQQQKFFVERKVMESIQRIEQKGNGAAPAEEDNNSQNALRIALTQSTTQKASAAKGKANKKKVRADTPPGSVAVDKEGGDSREEPIWMLGRFSTSVLLHRRDREEGCTALAKQFFDQGLPENIIDETENKEGSLQEGIEYMFDPLTHFHVARLDYSNGKFKYTPLDLELQRQLIMKNAALFASSYMERVRRGEGLIIVDDCADMPEMFFGDLFKPNKDERIEARLAIIDKEARFLDAKIRLYLLEDDYSFSDAASQCSSDSDSGSGEGPRLKRSRCDIDERCDHCLAERLSTLTLMPATKKMDMQCQTDPISDTVVVAQTDIAAKKAEGEVHAAGDTVPPPVPTVRMMQRRPTAKAVSKKNSKAAAVQKISLCQLQPIPNLDSSGKDVSAQMQTSISSLGEMVEANQFVQGMFLECSKNVQLDQKMEEFLRASLARVWTMVRLSDERIRYPAATTNTMWDGIYTAYGGELQSPQQVNLALSVVAICCLNAKKADEKLTTITHHIDKKIRTLEIHQALRTLCKVGDMVVVLDEEDAQGSPALNDDRKNSGEDYLLTRHLERLDQLQQKAEKYPYLLHYRDAERLLQAVVAIENKISGNEKEKNKLQTTIEEQKKEKEKVEKNNQKTVSELRAEKEAKDKVNNQLKEKNKEIKKMEKRIKELSQMVEEKDELREQKEQLQKDMAAEKKRSQDWEGKAKREMQAKDEQRRHFQTEISNRDQDYSRLLQANEDLKAAHKKLENQLTSERRNSHAATMAQSERAKKSEVQYLDLVLETGLKKLERAKEDALKNMKDMEDAAANRARTPAEQQAFSASRDEWRAKGEEIKVLIRQARNDYTSHVDAIKSGRPLSQLTKMVVAKPPPPCKILPIPPPAPVVVPVPEAKPTPGVIGSRSTSSAGHLPAPIGSNISPKNKAPGSPIQKPVAAVASQPQATSPARHPGAIGSRITNGNETTVTTAATSTTTSSSTAGGSSWHWNDYNFSDNILSTNRSFGSLTGDYPAASSNSTTTTAGRETSNGWSEDSWSQKAPGATSSYLGGIGTSSTNYAAVWEDRRPAQPPPQPQPQQPNRYAVILEKLAEIFRGVPNAKLVEWANDYCTQYKTNLSHETIQSAVQVLQAHIMAKLKTEHDAAPRRLLSTPLQPPPGAAPGYLNMGGLLGLDPPTRQTPSQLLNAYNSLMEPSLLNGDSTRNVLGTDKWSL